MSWHYLQGPEAAYWEDTSLDGAPDALLRLMPTPEPCCSPDSATDASRDSRSGTTCGRSMGDLGEDPSTSSQVDSHAKTSAQPEREKGSLASVPDSGGKWRESWVKYDLNSHGWKTHQCLLEEALPWSSVTLPKWGMMRGGVLWERTTPGLLMGGNGSGFWRTPQAGDGQRGAQDADKRKAGGHGVRLMDQVAKFPTPLVGGANESTHGQISGRFRDAMATAFQKWPTPRAYESSESMETIEARRKRTGIAQINLTAAVKSWPTPTANEDAAGRPGANMQKMLGNHPEIRQDQDGGQLNPTWVEWLMGWPLLWTSTEPIPPETWRAWESAFRSEPTGCAASATGRCLPLSSSRGES